MYGLEEYGGGFESGGGEVKKFYKFEGEGFKGGREGSMAKRKTDLFEGGGVFRFAFWVMILKIFFVGFVSVFGLCSRFTSVVVVVGLLPYYRVISGNVCFVC